MSERCETCKFILEAHKPDGRYAEMLHGMYLCRRYPPTMFVVPDGRHGAAFPRVLPDAWCGEFKQMSLEQIIAENTAAIQALTAALSKPIYAGADWAKPIGDPIG